MLIISPQEKISISRLKELAEEVFGDLVKGVVDIKSETIAINGELHADEEALLLEKGSKQKNLWGINIYPKLTGKDFLEFDSMINLRPSQGNRSRNVEDKVIREKITQIIKKSIKK